MNRRQVLALGLLAPLAPRPASALLPSEGHDWPQWRGPGRDGAWRETGLIDAFPGPELKPRWRVPISNGYSGPTVAAGKVYAADRVLEPESRERVHCWDRETGRPLWSVSYPCDYRGVSYPNGPRSAVTIHQGRAYFLGALGHLHCLDAADGRVVWARDLGADYRIRLPDWGIAGSPLVEGDRVVVPISGEGACLVALDRETGREKWKALPDRATYSSPILITQGGVRVLVYWTADRVVGLNPGSGRLLWEVAHPSIGMNVDGIATPAVSGDRLLVVSVYEGALMIRLGTDGPTASKLWLRRAANPRIVEGLNSMIADPVFREGHIYGLTYFGELRCLRADDGDVLWEEKSLMPRAMWATAHLVQNGEQTWILTERGELILARLTPAGYRELGRSRLIRPTRGQLNQRGGVVWSHPAFAHGHVFARNDEELLCVDLRRPTG